MMTPDWTFKTGDAPQKAVANFSSLPAVKGSGDSVRGIWQGSGFTVDDLPVFTGSYRDDLLKGCRCNACQGRNVWIIFLDHCRDQSGCDIDMELVCTDCGKFTLAKGWN